MLPHSPAAERNREPILAVLRTMLPATGRVLEVASGTGQHVVHFASALPGCHWQPGDPDAKAREAIDARVARAGLLNVSSAIALDVESGPWPPGPFDAVFCANMIHIAPWSCTQGLLDGAARILKPGGSLLLYGPFLRDGIETAPGNVAFDADLRARNPAWGIRRLEAVGQMAAGLGLTRESVTEMPANNLLVRFVRSPMQNPRPSE